MPNLQLNTHTMFWLSHLKTYMSHATALRVWIVLSVLSQIDRSVPLGVSQKQPLSDQRDDGRILTNPIFTACVSGRDSIIKNFVYSQSFIGPKMPTRTLFKVIP